MRYWKQRGIRFFDWGGGGAYKEKYGPYPVAVPWFFKSRYKVLGALRSGAQELVKRRQRILGKLRRTEKKEEAAED